MLYVLSVCLHVYTLLFRMCYGHVEYCVNAVYNNRQSIGKHYTQVERASITHKYTQTVLNINRRAMPLLRRLTSTPICPPRGKQQRNNLNVLELLCRVFLLAFFFCCCGYTAGLACLYAYMYIEVCHVHVRTTVEDLTVRSWFYVVYNFDIVALLSTSSNVC